MHFFNLIYIRIVSTDHNQLLPSTKNNRNLLPKAQTPFGLLRFVVDLLYNKTTTNRSNGVCAYRLKRNGML